MAEIAKIAAQPRARVGKGPARAARRAGLVPAVIYGANKDPLSIALEPRALARELGKSGFFLNQFDIAVDGSEHRVLPRDVQFHPVTDAPLHVDFLRVTGQTRIDVEIPCHFLNDEESPGLKRGGVLNIVRHTIEVNTTVDNIPEVFTFDLTGLEIGDSLHISDITLPEGVKPLISDRDFTVATIAAPTAVRDEAAAEAEEAEAAEGEEAEEVEGEEAEAAEGEAEEGGESD